MYQRGASCTSCIWARRVPGQEHSCNTKMRWRRRWVPSQFRSPVRQERIGPKTPRAHYCCTSTYIVAWRNTSGEHIVLRCSKAGTQCGCRAIPNTAVPVHSTPPQDSGFVLVMRTTARTGNTSTKAQTPRYSWRPESRLASHEECYDTLDCCGPTCFVVHPRVYII